MTFEIEMGGRSRSVVIERAGSASRFRVVVDGRVHVVEARRAGDFGLLLTADTFAPKVRAAVADTPNERMPLPGQDFGAGTALRGAPRTYEVFVAPTRTAGEVLVTIEGHTAMLVVNGRRTPRETDTARQAQGEQRVVAPMAGRVMRVLVAPGDEVTASQGVVVVEAMKMENELRAQRAGRVKDVSVSAGTSVEAGRVLVVIE